MRNRRREPRLPADGLPVAHATLRPGCAVQLVDLSRAGAQVQADRPLRPGSRVHVRLVTGHHTIALAAVVLRCVVWGLDPDEGVVYRGALRFEERCMPFWEEPGAAEERPASRGDLHARHVRQSARRPA